MNITLMLLTVEGAILEMEMPSVGSAVLYGQLMVCQGRILAADAFENGRYIRTNEEQTP